MTILLVEDDKKTAYLIGKGLAKEGFTIDVAHSAEDAINQTSGFLYELVILDWMLPDKSGLSLCREWREQGVMMPVLMLTARDSIQDRIDGLNTGADDYLCKPFVFDELLARIRALMRRLDRTKEFKLSYADLKFDPVKRKAQRKDNVINVTPKESDILELLIRYPDEIITRVHLAEHIWHSNHIAIDNLIDSHMRNLRRKIDIPGVFPLIHTVRGEGFCLSLDNKYDEGE